ncbi:hypothetical protein NDU88_007388 [Pleurodeles waltl]|uniref:Uncharacterized protein n=1 Tax=Pleurodeles waltl TaxID=8319 RepID=A0AAV7PP46_PLEWA|nr:hypothetical protein NDU88_007388 [Pleurodeles waltl]
MINLTFPTPNSLEKALAYTPCRAKHVLAEFLLYSVIHLFELSLGVTYLPTIKLELGRKHSFSQPFFMNFTELNAIGCPKNLF